LIAQLQSLQDQGSAEAQAKQSAQERVAVLEKALAEEQSKAIKPSAAQAEVCHLIFTKTSSFTKIPKELHSFKRQRVHQLGALVVSPFSVLFRVRRSREKLLLD
jgi:hypothetical protein